MPRLKQDFSKRKAVPLIYVEAVKRRYRLQKPKMEKQQEWRAFAKKKWDKLAKETKTSWYQKQTLYGILKARTPGYCGITSTFIINNCGRSGERIVSREKIEKIKKEFAQFKKKNPKDKCWTKGLKIFECSKFGNEKAEKKMKKIEEVNRLKKKYGPKAQKMFSNIDYWGYNKNILNWGNQIDNATTWRSLFTSWSKIINFIRDPAHPRDIDLYGKRVQFYLKKAAQIQNMITGSVAKKIDKLSPKKKFNFFKSIWQFPSQTETSQKFLNSYAYKKAFGKRKVGAFGKGTVKSGKKQKPTGPPIKPKPKKQVAQKSLLSEAEEKTNEGVWKLIDDLNKASDKNNLSRDEFNTLMTRVRKVYETLQKKNYSTTQADFNSNSTRHWYTLYDIIESKLKPKFGQKIKFNGKKAWPLLWKSYQDILLFEPTELKDFDRYAMIGWKNNMRLNYD